MSRAESRMEPSLHGNCSDGKEMHQAVNAVLPVSALRMAVLASDFVSF